uniref:Poly(A) RNA polymerase mitochondrial-like central palm domain-containing protein n=1 Tax=Kalmanozyma brasiliensis (strain GHG001) TaxID=1365824 RepID=V5EHS9_KALBG
MTMPTQGAQWPHFADTSFDAILREEEKTRRTFEIQKRVQDGMDALQLENDDAAHRSAEVERRNRQREEDKEKRKLAIQKQVEDGIKAIQQEKQRERARVEADQDACRKWLSDLKPASAASAADATAETVDLYAAIGRQLRGFWDESRPGASSQAHRNEVIADVQRAITRKWPGQGLQVAAFGSSVTGLLTETSDLDLVLLDPTRPCGVGTPLELRRDTNGFVRHTAGMPEWYSTNQIANALRNSNKFKTIVPISSANVPIVKMVHRKYDIPADININERFGLYNSQLIQAYANLQPQIVRPLIFFLKHWFSRRDLNDPAGKRGSMTFSSYTIALMALQVLQMEGILPNLQSPSMLKSLDVQSTFLYSRFKRPRRGKNAKANSLEELAPPSQEYNVTFATGEMDLEPYKTRALQLAAADAPADCVNDKLSATDRLLGRMLVSFVRFYTQLDRRRQVVSVVNGAPLQRKAGSHPGHVLFDSASEGEGSDLNEGHAEASADPLHFASRDADARAALREEQKDIWAGEELVVQDPFIFDRNTSRNIKAASVEKWQSTMQSAVALLGVQNQGDVGHAPQVRWKDAPLILDLCLSDAVRQELEAVVSSAIGSADTATTGSSIEPWKLAEEAAALERKIAKQAAESLRQEKKKQARRAKASEARRLQDEAAMVEDMIDGINAGRVTGYASANVHELWRLRQDQDASTAKEPLAVPLTFSVSRPTGSAAPTAAAAKTDTNGAAPKQLGAQEAALSPTVSSKTDGSSESEDVDLVALRLEQAARVAES